MKELDNLKYELKQMLDNIERVRDYADSLENEKYAPYRYAGSGDLDAVNSSNWLGFESLIVFKSTERAIQFGNQFKELFKTAMGL